MTTIAAYIDKETVHIAGDSLLANDFHQDESLHSKIIEIKKDIAPICYIGFAGSTRFLAKLYNWKSYLTVTHNNFATYESVLEWSSEQLSTLFKNLTEEETFEILIITHGRIYKIQKDFFVTEVSCGYNAIGKGMEFALGSMFSDKQMNTPGETAVNKAVDAACTHGVGTGGKIWTYKI